MKRNKLLALVLVFAMLLPILTGCAGNTEAEATQTEAVGVNVDSLVETKGEQEEQQDESQETYIKDVVNFGLTQEINDVSPWVRVQGGAAQLIILTYQALCTKEAGGEVETVMLKNMNKVDTYTYECELYDYITDTADNNITASDVKFSVEMAQEKVLQAAMVCESIEITGDYTFTVHFKDTLALGEADTFFVQTNIVSQKAYEESPDGMVTTPVGTGRYVCTDFQAGYVISYEMADSYWQTDSSLSPRRTDANVKTINFYTISEVQQRLIAVQNGTVDMAQVSVDDVETVNALDGYFAADLKTNITQLMVFNCSKDSVCNDENVRKAIAYALNGESLCEVYTESRCMPVYDVSNPNFSDYYTDYYEAQAAENIYANDMAKVAEYLAAAGYGTNELTVTLVMPSSSETLATIIQSYLIAVGINCKVELYQGNIIAEYYESTTSWDIYITTQGSPSGFTVGTYDMVFNPSRYGHGANIMFLTEEDDPTLYELFYTASSLEGHSEESVKALHDYVAEKCYAKGLFQTANVFALTDEVDSVVLSENRVICVQCCAYSPKN